MKVLRITLWTGDEIYSESLMNAEGRLNISVVEPDVRIDRVTVEPDDPNSGVKFTHYGAKYTL